MNKGYAAWAARWRVPLGFALGVAYLIFSRPTVRLVVTGGGVALMGLGIRAWAAGYLEKGRRLAISGPYRYTRNPLYFGSFLMGSGCVLAGGSWALGLLFLMLFPLVYWPVMRHEEDFLRRHFADIYPTYAEKVPSFFPNGRTTPASGEEFRWERYRSNREYQAAFGYVAGVVFLALKILLR